jgi:NAD(P)-dependent dehydrogenase (short-subunit alcohol dehydrogenase family)
VLDRHRRIDILVNAAGGASRAAICFSTPLDEWRRVMDLNLTSAVIACRAVLPAMRDARAGLHRQRGVAGGGPRQAASSPTPCRRRR